MKVFKDLVEIKNACLGLGFFDGVHLGHRKLITELVEYSAKKGLNSVILSFKKSPAEKFFDDVKYINTLKEREDIISSLGVDYMIELDFNDELMNYTAEEYLSDILIKYFSPKFIICGFNHTFGRGKLGNSVFLEQNKQKYGYEFKLLPPIIQDGETVSSTLIKDALTKGNIRKANLLLDNNFKIGGKVIKGNQIGRTIGFPTANIDYPVDKVVIPFGVYKVNVKHNNIIYRGMLNFGKKPTISKTNVKPVAEVHIIGFNKEIYNENIEIYIVDRIRNEKRFESLDDLKRQIHKDMEVC
ncbi:MAG: bifunctional riboflavin kinase/FAD synthetase [Cyanobacteria bacterium RUI128]|nr:bifunctional riboflavin kinase/FAD synthetase [Cyanobacteria bacterium RUI128]